MDTEYKILEGLVKVNGVDIWKEFHAFLREEKEGEEENLAALLTPGKMKQNTAVDFREEDGEKYSKKLVQRTEARDVTLQFAIMAASRTDFMLRYASFVKFLKTGEDGWLAWNFPTLGLEMKTFCKEFPSYESLTNLWEEREHCGAFKVTLREPQPSF